MIAKTDAQSTILVVDDEPDIVELITYNLEQHGHRVISASNGVEALEAAKSQLPDLIVLDVMMPELTGTEVAKRLRAQSETASMPIIMLTARSEEADELEALGAGADDYITKPFSMQVLRARIHALTRRTSSTKGERQSVLSMGPISIDFNEHRATVDGKDHPAHHHRVPPAVRPDQQSVEGALSPGADLQRHRAGGSRHRANDRRACDGDPQKKSPRTRP